MKMVMARRDTREGLMLEEDDQDTIYNDGLEQ
jgi:hypothetical protein